MGNEKKCQYPDGWDVKIMGMSIDPCRYEEIDSHMIKLPCGPINVSVVRCIKCGYTKLEWAFTKKGKPQCDLYSYDFETGEDDI